MCMYVYVCVCMYVCMYVCMHVCMHVCMDVCMYCMYVYTYTCKCIPCTYILIHASVYIPAHLPNDGRAVWREGGGQSERARGARGGCARYPSAARLGSQCLLPPGHGLHAALLAHALSTPVPPPRHTLRCLCLAKP